MRLFYMAYTEPSPDFALPRIQFFNESEEAFLTAWGHALKKAPWLTPPFKISRFYPDFIGMVEPGFDVQFMLHISSATLEPLDFEKASIIYRDCLKWLISIDMLPVSAALVVPTNFEIILPKNT